MRSSRRAERKSNSYAQFCEQDCAFPEIHHRESGARGEGIPDRGGGGADESVESKIGRGVLVAGEVVCHLIMVEQAVIKGADRLLQSPPKPRPFLKRFHIPMSLVESRVIRRKSPIPLDPGLIGEKEMMLGQLRTVRERTLAFLEETKGKDLSNYHMAHPFLGTLNAYEWFQMIASHEVRHSKQMREIAGALPKSVTTLEK